MAVSVTKTDAGGAIVHDADADSTGENDVRGGPTTLLGVKVVNPDATIYYLKLYDHLAPNIGTTDPVEVIQIDASEDVAYSVNGGAGLPFTVGLSFAVVAEGGTAGTTDPTNPVLVTLETSS